SRLVKGEGAQGHAARAAVLDPHGAPGRKAWLGLARRLQASEPILSDENSRLALRIFESVGRTTPPDETTLQAREAAAHAALRTLDFARATAALQPLPRQDPDLQVLADLCADLAGLEDVPQRGLHVFGQSDLGPCLISATDKTIRLRVPTKIGQFHLRARASVIASCDLTGDGVDELLVAHNTRASACTVMMYGVRFEPKRGVNRNIGQLLGTCYDLCPGDLDGDGKSEVLVLTASAESMTILQLDPETLRPTRQLVFPTDEAPAGHWDHGLLLNLDGETGDEILLASSRPATPVVARGATKQGPTDALAELDLGAICQLETYQRGGIKPTQEGALAVVYDGPQAGIVLLGAGATSPLEFLARWPFPDELTSPDKTRVAVFKTQGGDRYVLRSYHAGSEWVLDATSLASLESGTPRRLLITRTARTARTSYRAAAFLTGNADGDPASELVLSDSLCGRPQVGSQSLLPQAVGAPEAYAALRAIREDAGAAALLDSLPASARPKAELGWLDLQAERRVLRENEARVGFASRHPGPSRDQLSEAEALGRAVVRGALALTKKPLSAPDRWRARRYGLEAAARAEDWAKVYTLSKATLGELRVAPNEIAAWKRRATRHSSLRVQDYKPWDPRRPFALSHPIRSPLRKDSTRLGIDSHSEEWIFAQLELSPSSLIEIQLEVELLGGVSYGTVQAGLVEGDSGHTKLTGVEIWLYNTSGPRVGFARFVVGSHPVSTWVELPGAKGRLRARLRAELGPGGGEVVAELHFADELILSSAGHADFRYSLPRRAKFGAIAKRTAKGFLEDPRFARRGWLGLLRFALGTTGTVKVASVREPFASFGTLARGNNREAISELSRALGSFRSSQPTRALILIARGMAKGRLGQKAAAYADFRASLKAAPLEFVWWLELCGEDLRGADAALLHGFLETMERSNSPTQADTARSLRGDLWSVPRSAAGKNRQVLNLLDYLGFRRADLPNGERFAGGTRYQSRMGSRLQLPWSKFPAIAAPTDVPLPAERFQELLAVEGSLLRRYAALSAAAQGRPDSPAPHLRLAEVFIEAKLLGDAEAALERALELTPLGERPAIEVEIAVVLERLGELAAAASRLRALRKVGHPVAGLAARFPTLSRDPIYLKLFK
ncbi:MAG: VCBS repeat-containing protein, partial [Planctomycetes bacterium]|nr:VCBS repeat-containing protein [Planctomycetota bacterium]